jgi:rsbT co-antagonist protein RsbR
MSALPQNPVGLAISTLLARDEQTILNDWLKAMSEGTRRADLIKESDLRSQCAQFLKLLRQASETGGTNFKAPAWGPVREMLAEVSRSRALQGFSPLDTATFVFSFKRPLFARFQQEY